VLKFIITLSIVTLAILGLAVWGIQTPPEFLYQTLIFLFLTTIGLYRFLVKTKQERPDYFVQLFLLTLVVKLVASSAYLFVVAQSQADPAPDIVFFMGVYIVFTGLEIGFLYGRVNHS
jgi:hypothetical protein